MLKYIKTQNLGMIIFPNNRMDHSQMWDLVGGENDVLISAGFVSCGNEDVMSCYGESFSLKVSSLSEDTVTLRRMLAT